MGFLYYNNHTCVEKVERNIDQLSSWSDNSYKRAQNVIIHSSEKSIQQKSTVKILGVTFDQHFFWNEQVNNIRSAHGIHHALRNFSRFTES